MQGPEYHDELTPIVTNIIHALKEEQGMVPQGLELEIKHAYFKGPKYLQGELQAVKNNSQHRIVVLSLSTNNHRKFKVNARCDQPYFQNATSNLNTLAKRTACKVVEKYVLFVNWQEERFVFDCSIGKWIREDKAQLFPQCNLISKKKLYRINFCRKEEYENVDELVKELKINDWSLVGGFMRFKHSFIYQIDAHYSIECNTIYETELQQDYLQVEKAIQKNGKLDPIVKQKLSDKKNETKNELELKITPKGIEYLRKASVEEKKILVSKAFDQVRDISNQSAESDIIKMMSNLTLDNKQAEKEKAQKVEKKQATEDIPQPRREYRKRE